jgi:hypothetical protein
VPDTVHVEPSSEIPLGDRFPEAVADAGLLLRYAAETGQSVPSEVVEPILLARTALGARVWTDAAITSFFAAFTRLAAMLKPVSIASLKMPEYIIKNYIAQYRCWGMVLTTAVIALSLANFVNSGLAERVRQDIDDANALAVTLSAALAPTNVLSSPKDACIWSDGGTTVSSDSNRNLQALTQLQRFAADLRDIDSRSVKLNWFIFRIEDRPTLSNEELQLDPQLLDMQRALVCKISAYQDVRNFAQNILADDSVLFGAFAAYLLPVLYAVLGAFAYQIRLFTQQVRTRSFEPSRANAARIIAAVVAGSIVSLFNGFTQTAALSPLAIAFLVGYGVEIFYAFLDRMVTAFASLEPPGGRPPAASSEPKPAA